VLSHFGVNTQHNGSIVCRNERPSNRAFDPLDADMRPVCDRIVGFYVIWQIKSSS
jgi:hypothetical protein